MKTLKNTTKYLLQLWVAGILGMVPFAWGGGAAVSATPQPTLYLDLQHTYELKGFGVNLDVAVTHEGIVFIADPSRSRLWRRLPGSDKLTPFHLRGISKSRTISPAAITVDDQGSLWIVDALSHDILICSTDGDLLTSISRSQVGTDRLTMLKATGSNRLSAWDPIQKQLLDFRMDGRRIVVESRQIPSSFDMGVCLAASESDILCLDRARENLARFSGGQIKNQQSIQKITGESYSRAAHFEAGPNGYVYVTDAASHRLFYLSPNLEFRGEFLRYRRELQTPGRFAFQGQTHFWLIDEGRRELLEFKFRKAVTGPEHALLAEEYLAAGYVHQALAEARFAESSGYPSKMLLGKIHYALMQYETALEAFYTAARQGERSAMFWIGNALFRQKRFQEAAAAYQKALESHDDKLLAYFNLGQAYMAQHLYDQARPAFEAAVRMDPNYSNGHIGLGRSYIGLQQYQNAVRIFEALSKQVGTQRIGRHYLGIVYFLNKDYDIAIPYLERASAEGPYFREALAALEKAYRYSGNQKLAAETAKARERIFNEEAQDDILLEDQPI